MYVYTCKETVGDAYDTVYTVDIFYIYIYIYIQINSFHHHIHIHYIYIYIYPAEQFMHLILYP